MPGVTVRYFVLYEKRYSHETAAYAIILAGIARPILVNYLATVQRMFHGHWKLIFINFLQVDIHLQYQQT